MKTNRVVGLIGIGAINSNWNADFSKMPNQTSGVLTAHDTTLKYECRKYWNNKNKNIFTKAMRDNDGDLMNDKDRYKAILNKEATMNLKETAKEIFRCIDVKNFGCVYTGGKSSNNKKNKSDDTASTSFGIEGVVQFGLGINKYEDTNVEIEKVMSPKPSSDNKQNNNLGDYIFTDESHYVYDLEVNPNAINEFIELCGDDVAYTEDDYNEFKDAILSCVTVNNKSRIKKGCYNEFALFVEFKDDLSGCSSLLSQHVNIVKDNENNKTIINLDEVSDCLNVIKNNIKNIEIFYDPAKTIVKFKDDLFKSVERKHILAKNLNLNKHGNIM